MWTVQLPWGTTQSMTVSIDFLHLFHQLKVPTLMKATADDENPCPGYLFQEIGSILWQLLLWFSQQLQPLKIIYMSYVAQMAHAKKEIELFATGLFIMLSIIYKKFSYILSSLRVNPRILL